ncbi:MAG: UDP-N-acetylmuramoyl-tripeptide--D-alanyl-D-alanine ligase [Candidatus Eremiobacteraeota bacterium]|nr:UDP-N-acetylmuramoyl-tripeptide--D-alanyl-D-alanine ligase [Candidatus Eremiobacteraeota bacterium]
MKLPLETAVEATRATLVEAQLAPPLLHIATDTRSLQSGDAFVALRGENFDGHAFVGDAVRRGATVAVVDRRDAIPPGVAALVVGNTLEAYMALAHAARKRFGGRVIAITGSAGKTTTKVLLTQLLAPRYGARIAVAPANENNEIGVSKLLLNLSNEEHDVAVVEMGARKFGDIALLVKIAEPHAGILTNIGEAHLEIMGSRERLAQTKWGLFSGGARPVLNADDAASVARAASLPAPPHWFAAREAGAQIALFGRATVLVGTTHLSLFGPSGNSVRIVDVRLPGAHNRANLAAAIAGSLELDVPVDDVVAAIPDLRLPEGRFQSFVLPAGWRIIYDAYNANATGTMAALDAFADESPARGIAVLGSMAELGDESVVLHEQVGAHAAGCVDVLLVGGEYADAMARGAERGGLAPARIVRIATNGEAAEWLRNNARRGDVVLLKGSRKYKLEEIVKELLA